MSNVSLTMSNWSRVTQPSILSSKFVVSGLIRFYMEKMKEIIRDNITFIFTIFHTFSSSHPSPLPPSLPASYHNHIVGDLEPLIEPWPCTYSLIKSALYGTDGSGNHILHDDSTEQLFHCGELEINLTKLFLDSLTVSRPLGDGKKGKGGGGEVVGGKGEEGGEVTVVKVEVMICNQTGKEAVREGADEGLEN